MGWFGKKKNDNSNEDLGILSLDDDFSAPIIVEDEISPEEVALTASATPAAPVPAAPTASAAPAAPAEPAVRKPLVSIPGMKPAVSAPASTAAAAAHVAPAAARPDRPAPSAPVAASAAPPAGHKKESPRAIFKKMINGFHDAIIVTDGKGHVMDCSIRVSEFFKYSDAELWDKPIMDMVQGLNQSIYDRVKSAIGKERYVMMTTRCVRKDGTTFPAELGISLFQMMGTDQFVVTVRNIERRMMALRDMKSIKSAFDASIAAGFVSKSDGTIVAANKEMGAMIGLTPMEAVGKNLTSMFDGIREAMAKAAAGEVVEMKTRNLLTGDGRDLTIRLAPNALSSTKIDGVVGSIIRGA